ncbi:MAG TPA: energy transducer TonB [Pyrinomonadaceae bacterium]|nr:energy transducer TonB [Pyrinomonadaceae bacterium]
MQTLLVKLSLIALVTLTPGVSALAQTNLTAKNTDPRGPAPVAETDRIRDGLVGPVRRVRTAVAKLSTENGKSVEGKESVIEIVAYDVKGTKVENQYFPIAGSTLTGKEVYKYDDKGNISEMTLLNEDGSLLGKEIYKYEFDFVGNWNKMTTSVAVIEGGKMSFEQTEVTHRSIMYYLDEKMMKMAQPAVAPSSVSPTNSSVANNDDKAGSPSTKPADTKSQALPSVTSRKPVTLDSNVGAQLVASNANTTASPSVRFDAEPPAAPAPRPILKPVSGGVLNGTAINLPSPSYPDTARRLRMAGVVVIQVVVDETGKVISAEAVSGPSLLKDAALQAALKARFSPTKLSGQPVKVSGVINYKFGLQ